MRRNFTRAISLLLSAAMLAGMCMTAGAAKKSGADVELTPAGTYPIVAEGEELEFDVFIKTMPTTENIQTNDFTKYLEELTGIRISFQTGNADDWSEKLNIQLASNDYPDMILGVSPDLAKYGVKEQMIIPLDDYLTEENCPNYLAMMEQYGLDMTREADGKIYSLADINECYHCRYGRKLWINQRYLDEMGCGMPSTTEEFYDVCEKFLAYKPDGVAIAGASTGWFTRAQDFLIDAFVLMPSASYTTNSLDTVALDKNTGEMVCVGLDDRYREAMKYIHSLYELGAIYDGDFTQDPPQLKTLINQADEPVLCFAQGAIANVIDADANPDFYADYVAMEPLEGPDGTKIAYEDPNAGVSSGGFCITDKCQNVEAALRWIDFFYSETGDLCSQYGADEGVDWVLNPEGKFGLNGEPALYDILNPYSSEVQNHDWQDEGVRVAPAYYRLGQAADLEVDVKSSEGLEKLLYDVTSQFYEPYAGGSDIQLLDELKMTDEESSAISVITVEVEKIIEETSVAFITGSKDIESGWDSYVDSVWAAGLQDLLDTYAAAYARMYGSY